jgi:transposase
VPDKKPPSLKYPPELRERAVRMVDQTIAETGERWGVVARIARQLGIGEQTLRNWVRQAEIDVGSRQGVTTEEKGRVAELEKEVRELRRANAILKSAASFMSNPRLCADEPGRGPSLLVRRGGSR